MKNGDLEKITNRLEGEQDQRYDLRPSVLKGDQSVQLPRLFSLRLDQLTTRLDLRAISNKSLFPGPDLEGARAFSDMPTSILPNIHAGHTTNTETQKGTTAGNESQGSVLRKLVKSSGLYALSSVTVPLVSLVLAPFLTHHLSPSDFGALAVINTLIGLCVGITQLGLASAFFRAYSYDLTAPRDRRDVVATTTALLYLVSIPMTIVVAITAPWLANLLFGQSLLGNSVSFAGAVVLLQNLTIPGMSWLRAENRPLSYSLLSIINLLVMLFANIFLVGVLHLGVSGSIIAMGSGYACIVICTIPIIVLRTGIKIRVDIAQNLLAFGLPLTISFVSYWVLQLSDRYLLSRLGSLTITAHYTVAYTLGSAMSVVIMGPFNLAWPTMFFTIAKRKDATEVFKLVFRWFGMFLLFAAFAFTLVATFLLDWLFPVSYRSATFVIPVVAESIAFSGVYSVFMVGVSIKRKTWLIAVFTTVAAIVNFVLNLFLIPLYGAMGAAISTLIAYTILALLGYVANQRLYPIQYEIGTFIIALVLGIGLYIGSVFLAQGQGSLKAWGISLSALVFFGGCLGLLIYLSSRMNKNASRYTKETILT